MTLTCYDVTALAEAALSGLTALDGVTVDIREPAAVSGERDAAAIAAGGLLILTPETEDWKTLTNQTARLHLPFRATFVTAGNQQYADRTALSRKHSVRLAVWQRLLQRGAIEGAAGVTYEPQPAYDASALEKLYRVSKQRFVATVGAARAEAS